MKRKLTDDDNMPQLKNEPIYVEEGEEFGEDFSSGTRRPKWMFPKGPIQKMILNACGKQYYATHNERSAVIAIEKSTLYLSSGIISVYPTEWVESCVEWAKRKRQERVAISFLALINLINNSDRRTQFIQKWAREHSEIVLKKEASVNVAPQTEELHNSAPSMEIPSFEPPTSEV